MWFVLVSNNSLSDNIFQQGHFFLFCVFHYGLKHGPPSTICARHCINISHLVLPCSECVQTSLHGKPGEKNPREDRKLLPRRELFCRFCWPGTSPPWCLPTTTLSSLGSLNNPSPGCWDCIEPSHYPIQIRGTASHFYDYEYVGTMYYKLCTMYYVLCAMYYILCTMYSATCTMCTSEVTRSLHHSYHTSSQDCGPDGTMTGSAHPSFSLHGTSHQTADIRQPTHQKADTRHQTPDTRHQTPDTRHQIPDTRYRHQTPDTNPEAGQVNYLTPYLPDI